MTRVFVIHRETTIANVLRRELKPMKLEIASTNALAEVAMKVKDFNPDILLISGRLIGGTGAEALRAIRRSGCKTPVIAISSDGEANYNDRIVAVGREYDGYVAIPILRDPANHIPTLREMLERFAPLFP